MEITPMSKEPHKCIVQTFLCLCACRERHSRNGSRTAVLKCPISRALYTPKQEAPEGQSKHRMTVPSRWQPLMRVCGDPEGYSGWGWGVGEETGLLEERIWRNTVLEGMAMSSAF